MVFVWNSLPYGNGPWIGGGSRPRGCFSRETCTIPERLVRPQFDSPQKKKNALESVSAYPLTVDFKTLTDVDLLVVFRTYQLRM